MPRPLKSNCDGVEKEFGTNRETLPKNILTKRILLERFATRRQRFETGRLSEQQVESAVWRDIIPEIKRLYKIMGFSTITDINMMKKLQTLKKEHRASKKNPQAAAKFDIDERVSFLSGKQPQSTLREDIEWYQRKMAGGQGAILGLDMAAAARQEARELRIRQEEERVQQERARVEAERQAAPQEVAEAIGEDVERGEAENTEPVFEPAAELASTAENVRSDRKIDWCPLAQVAQRFGVSAEGVQEILVQNARINNLPMSIVPSDTTLQHAKKRLLTGLHDAQLADRLRQSEFVVYQFDGKEVGGKSYEVVLAHHLIDGEVKEMPAEVLEFKTHPKGDQLGLALHKFITDEGADAVLALGADTTNVNSGIGEIGGACMWYQRYSDAKCLIVMCRIHSQECISGKALDHFSSLSFAPLDNKPENAPSGTVKSIKVMCQNMKEISKYIDIWEGAQEHAIWPPYYSVDDLAEIDYKLTDVQGLLMLLLSKKIFTKAEYGKAIVQVGVRWLGYFTSLLHISLTIEHLIPRLKCVDPATELPSVTARSYLKNLIEMLEVFEREQTVRDNIFKFASVHFLCWRMAIMSNGCNLLDVCIETSKMYTSVGIEMNLPVRYFSTIARHLYNMDPVFLPLSANAAHAAHVADILEEEWVENSPVGGYAKFEDQWDTDFDNEELANLSVETLVTHQSYRRLVARSPIFYHLQLPKDRLITLYRSGAILNYELFSLIPGHNQACEREVNEPQLM